MNACHESNYDGGSGDHAPVKAMHEIFTSMLAHQLAPLFQSRVLLSEKVMLLRRIEAGDDPKGHVAFVEMHSCWFDFEWMGGPLEN